MHILHIYYFSTNLKKGITEVLDMLMGGYYPFVIMIIWLVVGIAGARM